MLDIQNRVDILARLARLTPEQKGIFGKMTPQHMVEHLTNTIRFSNGKDPRILMFSDEKAAKMKQVLVYSEYEMMVGFRAPMLTENLELLQYKDLETAIAVLKSELETMDTYFLQNPEATPMNPSLGVLNYKEWLVFHNKHFNHHFKQFELLD